MNHHVAVHGAMTWFACQLPNECAKAAEGAKANESHTTIAAIAGGARPPPACARGAGYGVMVRCPTSSNWVTQADGAWDPVTAMSTVPVTMALPSSAAIVPCSCPLPSTMVMV